MKAGEEGESKKDGCRADETTFDCIKQCYCCLLTSSVLKSVRRVMFRVACGFR
jgi:hypothetical protein